MRRGVYRPAARLFAGATVTAAAALFALPHALVTRTQYCVAAWMGGGTYVGALPPTGWAEASTGPSYHWNISDRPRPPTFSVALVPAGRATSCGCAVMTGAVHAATMSTAATALSAVPHRFVARSQYVVGAKIGGVTSCAALPLGAGCD